MTKVDTKLKKLSELKNSASPDLVKTTAIAYIREAVAEERFEVLKDMIAIAQEVGASAWDIRIALMGDNT